MLERFFRDAFWIAVTNLVLQLKGLILIPLLTKKFGAIGYGTWAQVGVLVGVLSPLLGIGIEYGYSRHMPARVREEQARFLWSLVWLQTSTAILCGVCLWLFSKPLSMFLLGSADEYILVIVCGLVVYANLLLNDVKSFFRIGRNPRFLNVVVLIQGFGNLVAVYVVYLAGGGVLEIVAVGTLFDLFLAALFLGAIAWKYGIWLPDLSMARKFITYGWVLLPAGYAMWILNLSDRLFLAHYRTLADIGVYSVAYTIGCLPILLILSPIWMFYSPVATKAWEKRDFAEIKKIFSASIKLIWALILLFVGLLVTFYRPFMLLITSEEFLAGPWLAVIICMGYTFSVVGSYGAVTLGLAMRPKLVTYTHIGAAIVNILFNWLLIPAYGIYGAAVATCLAFSLQCVAEFSLGAKYLSLKLPLLFMAKCCIAVGALLVASHHIYVGFYGFASVSMQVLLFCILYVLMLFVLGVYTKNDVLYILRRIVQST